MFFSLLKRAFNGFLRRYLGTQVFRVHYLGRETEPRATDLDEVVKPLSIEDFLLGDKEEFTPGNIEVIKNRFGDNSYRAYGVIENQKLIYSSWISLEKLGLPVVLKEGLQLADEQGYIEDSYCSVQARGRGIHTRMISYQLSRLYDYGKKSAVVTVIEGNIPALKANLKNGMIDLGVFYCGKILWRPFCSLSKEKKAMFDSKLHS